MRRILLTAAAVALSSSFAMAADMPVKAPVYQAPVAAPVAYTWTGFYVGGQLGYHWDRDSASGVAGTGFGASFIPGINTGTPGTVNPRGVIGGMQAGYNWQSNNVVWGLEGDVNFSSGSASRTVVLFGVNPFTTTAESTFNATLRGRVGLVVDRALFYVTGGLAVSNPKFTDSYGFFAGTVISSVSTSTTRAGWTVGGGLEYAIINNWSMKLEYLYEDFGSVDAIIPSCAACVGDNSITVTHKYTENIARVGLNYKFGGH